MEDFFDDDFIDYDMPEEENCEEMEIIGGDILNDAEIHSDAEDPPDPGISFEDFIFYGGYIGMMIDEEREERRRMKKKEKGILDPDSDVKEKDDF